MRQSVVRNWVTWNNWAAGLHGDVERAFLERKHGFRVTSIASSFGENPSRTVVLLLQMIIVERCDQLNMISEYYLIFFFLISHWKIMTKILHLPFSRTKSFNCSIERLDGRITALSIDKNVASSIPKQTKQRNVFQRLLLFWEFSKLWLFEKIVKNCKNCKNVF